MAKCFFVCVVRQIEIKVHILMKSHSVANEGSIHDVYDYVKVDAYGLFSVFCMNSSTRVKHSILLHVKRTLMNEMVTE